MHTDQIAGWDLAIVRSRMGSTGDFILARRRAAAHGGARLDRSAGYCRSRGVSSAKGYGYTSMASTDSAVVREAHGI
jgi:hypothetical protein